ncbi:MAG: HNH endonuclease [Fimbriimonas sp.]|nr:HNH endonuclease [Fimbriimonas sp.]
MVDGFPDFGEHVIADVHIQPTKTRYLDQMAANAKRGLPKEPDYIWHHHQDYGRMQLVRGDIHRATGHHGGFKLWRPFVGKP